MALHDAGARKRRGEAYSARTNVGSFRLLYIIIISTAPPCFDDDESDLFFPVCDQTEERFLDLEAVVVSCVRCISFAGNSTSQLAGPFHLRGSDDWYAYSLLKTKTSVTEI